MRNHAQWLVPVITLSVLDSIHRTFLPLILIRTTAQTRVSAQPGLDPLPQRGRRHLRLLTCKYVLRWMHDAAKLREGSDQDIRGERRECDEERLGTAHFRVSILLAPSVFTLLCQEPGLLRQSWLAAGRIYVLQGQCCRVPRCFISHAQGSRYKQVH